MTPAPRKKRRATVERDWADLDWNERGTLPARQAHFDAAFAQGEDQWRGKPARAWRDELGTCPAAHRWMVSAASGVLLWLRCKGNANPGERYCYNHGGLSLREIKEREPKGPVMPKPRQQIEVDGEDVDVAAAVAIHVDLGTVTIGALRDQMLRIGAQAARVNAPDSAVVEFATEAYGEKQTTATVRWALEEA